MKKSSGSWSILMLSMVVLLCPACRSRSASQPAEKRTKVAKTSEPVEARNRLALVTNVTVLPEKPNGQDDLTVDVVTDDPDGDSVTLMYQWYLNGEKLMGEIGSTLSADQFDRGDRIEVEVSAHDGKEAGTVRKSTPITIRNVAPQLVGDPSPGSSLDGFRMEVSDPDNDPITYKLVGGPPNLTVDPDGTLQWSPTPTDRAARYDVTLVASDGQGGTVSVQFPLEITASQGLQPAGQTQAVGRP